MSSARRDDSTGLNAGSFERVGALREKRCERGVVAHAPGRTELAGNHTDHQGGRVVAATLRCGVSMRVAPVAGQQCSVRSEGFPELQMDLARVEPRESERFTTQALVRGVVAGVRALGVPVGGCAVQAQSDIPAGGGLSSSAAFELALAAALVLLFGSAEDAASIDANRLALIGQAAERDYFGKPCGLMDQLSIAHGGINVMDFSGEEAVSKLIDFDLASSGYALCLIDTHCDHSRYTDAYAQVAKDMDAVARALGQARLCQVPEERFMERFEWLRAQLGDVPALRGLHYYHEMALVDERVRALEAGDMDAFLDATRRSGASSAQFLQNVSTFDRAEQPAMVALALCERLLCGDGACRIHGGGFGGTVQAFVPAERVDEFASRIDAHLGEGSCRRHVISNRGAYAHWE